MWPLCSCGVCNVCHVYFVIHIVCVSEEGVQCLCVQWECTVCLCVCIQWECSVCVIVCVLVS